MSDLGTLFRTAREYGRVSIYTQSDGTYHCCIEFASIAHTKLEARSDFKQPSPEAAVQMAIDSAEAIVRSVSKTSAFRRLLGGGI